MSRADELVDELVSLVLMQYEEIKKLERTIKRIKQYIEVYEEYIEGGIDGDNSYSTGDLIEK